MSDPFSDMARLIAERDDLRAKLDIAVKALNSLANDITIDSPGGCDCPEIANTALKLIRNQVGSPIAKCALCFSELPAYVVERGTNICESCQENQTVIPARPEGEKK